MSTEASLHVHDIADSVTPLLKEAQQGRTEAWDRIYALLYEDLHRIARSQIRQLKGRQLSPTSLISESWLRLTQANLSAENRSHLTALFARAMRYVLIDQARRVLSQKRGEGAELLPLDRALVVPAGAPLEQLLQMDQALDALAKLDERAARVVEMRYFGGMKEAEIAATLNVTERTISREWRKARAFLRRHFDDTPS
ncbi:ECF-type sigma factor [Rhodanobacter sp. L36]|uniref:ECF-type sigma factor n=1 Tax=Rhodanobacter sp. L36 TaxID=1747221 RepID=UPI00131AD7E4|nr:ECF-type sigma factor [Rhodanobacter sp. L36]